MTTAALRELYQEVIIDHNRHPRHHYAMTEPTAKANGFNPLCGDKLTVYLKIIDDKIEAISFLGTGCAISQASASLMTDTIVGKTLSEARHCFECVHGLLTKADETALPSVGKLAVLSGVKAYPARVKCATLAWHTLEAALTQANVTVSTE